MKQTPSIAVILVSAFILMGGCISGSSNEIGNEVQEKEEENEWFRSENDWLVLSAAITSSSLNDGISCEVHLENKSDQTIQHMLVNPWNDVKPRLVDEAGELVPTTDIGRVRLGPLRRRFSSILHDLRPGESHQWQLDLDSTYKLQPAAYVLEISVEFWVGGGDWQSLSSRERQKLSLKEIPVRIAAESRGIEGSDVVNEENEGNTLNLRSDDIVSKIDILPITDAYAQEGEVRLKVERDKEAYLLGEPIFVRYRIVNGTKESITLPWNFIEEKGAVDFEVRDSEGREIERLVQRQAIYRGPNAITIPSEKELINTIDLRYWYAIRRPGTYQVVAKYISEGGFQDRDALGERIRRNGWAGELSFDVGEFEVRLPSSRVDVDALDELRVPLRGSEEKYKYALMFDVARREKPEFVEKYPTSRYTAYLLFDKAERTLSLHNGWRRAESAERALRHLEKIQIEDYPGLFQELALHRLTIAHIGSGSSEDLVETLIEKFRNKFPESPYKLPGESEEAGL